MVKKNYKPRVFIILIFFLILYLIILTRFLLLQVHKKDFFENLAKQQYETELQLSPPRAKIYDINKEPLVFNFDVTSAFILPRQFNEKEKTKKFLKKHFKNVYDKIFDKNKKFLWIERNLSQERLDWFKKFDLKDIYFIDEPLRFYPFNCMSTIIGFTDIDNVGISGVELAFNKKLAGVASTVRLEKDARSGHFYFEKEILQEGQSGKPVQVTIDSKLQFLVYEELKNTIEQHEAKSGSAIILDPESGYVLAMANYPDFDPNKKNLENIENTKNRVITECYELGSVFKTFTALAALEEKVTTSDELIDCEGKVAYIDKFRVENWKSTGIVPFYYVVQRSSNIGIAKVAKRLGPKLYEHLTRLGFGKKTGIQFPGERDGFVNHPKNWSKPSVITMSFGYEINTTIMQLAKAFGIIANGGYDFEPVLVMPEMSARAHNKLYSDNAIIDIKNILQNIGKVYNQGLQDYCVMGKTGTARAIKNGKYSRLDHVYSFGGIIEKDNYKRVIVTFVQEPKGAGLWASQVAAPLFNKIAQKMVMQDLVCNHRVLRT
ncbi:penicillin-binding protein 2 [Candidatus Babeliales bacterium]|nr:penicillin-binding protein 2 [Candidatus Babeliales bacterium]MCF7899090.1 penicillin-binding protein 2 [Candidatus Babeliales bacterium]